MMRRSRTRTSRRKNPLVVFDFDDTLIRSDGTIKVIHADGTEDVMTTDEFARYSQRSGDVYDFSGLSDKNAVVSVLPHFSVMLDAIAGFGPAAVVVLTARHDARPVRRMLTSLGIPRTVEVVAAASADPQSKVNWIREKATRGQHYHVEFYDDNLSNVMAVKRLAKELPRVRLSTHWVRDA